MSEEATPTVVEAPLKTAAAKLRLSQLTLLPEGKNARFMTNAEFTKLVNNIRRDGCLTSAPLIHEEPDGTLRVVSGNHRVQAASEALGADTEVDVLMVEGELTKDRLIALQLSHNAIAGQDDPVLLAQLYAEIEDLDMREYAALDDEQLALLGKVEIAPLREPSLDFQTLSIMFLPAELDAARKVMDEAYTMVRGGNERWCALYDEHRRLLDAIDLASGAYDIKDRAASLALVLDVFDRHRDDLVDGFARDGEALHEGWVPIAAVTATDRVPAPTAAKLAKAADKMISAGTVSPGERWRVIDELVKAYLA